MYQYETELISKAGLTVTNQRILILHYILEVADHPTAEEVNLWAQKNLPKMSLSTVYNTLNTFVDKGLIQAIRPPSSKAVYYDKNTDNHYHLIDTETGKFFDINEKDVKLSHKLKNYEIENVDVFIYGKRK